MTYYKLRYNKSKDMFELLEVTDTVGVQGKYIYATEENFKRIKPEMLYTRNKKLEEYVKG